MAYHQLKTKEGNRFYREVGNGEPVVLLHCSAGSSSAWLPVIDHFNQRYHAQAPDLLGYGCTVVWPRDRKLGQDDELGVVEALMERARRPVHLVGHSYGGAIALRAAVRFRPLIASLTLIEPVAFHLLRRAQDQRGWNEIAALAERHMALVQEGRDATAADAFLSYWMGPMAAHLPDASREAAARSAAKVASEWRLMFEAEDDHAAIAEIDVPTLLISGGRTRAPARQVIELLRKAMPAALHHELKDAGHMSPLTHPAEVAELVGGHIDRATPQLQATT